MWLLKTIAGRVVSAVIGTIVFAGLVVVWRMDPTRREAMMSGTAAAAGTVFGFTGKTLGWILLAGVLPWATFFLSTWMSRFRRNAAGAALVVAYTAADASLLAWLFDWSVRGATAWVFYAGAVLVALVYNVLTCDWIAERFGSEA